MLIKKNKILFILIIILIGNVFAYTNYNSFLVGTISVVKEKKILAENIEYKFSKEKINYEENNFEKTSFKEYENFNEKKCYQENPKISNNCGAENKGNYYYEIKETKGLIYINYSKPEKATDQSLWQVKWGYDSNSKEPYYLRYNLPLDCWNQEEIQFKIYSGDPQNYEIGGYCFNGYEWKKIFFESYKDICEKTVEASPKLALDGDYSTGIFQGYYQNKQRWLRTVNSENKNSIYEEGMIWIFLDSLSNYEAIQYKNNNSDETLNKLIYLDNNKIEKKDFYEKNKFILIILSFIIFISIIILFFLLKKQYKISTAIKNLEKIKEESS
jgi:hypothetical protein